MVEDMLVPGQPEIAADVPEVAMSFAIDAIDEFIPGSHDVYAPIEVMEDKIVSSDGAKESDVEDILVPVDAVEDVLIHIDAVENMLDPCQVLEPVE